MDSLIFDIIGWIGSGLVLVAYYLMSTKKLPAKLTYQVLNLVAAICIAIGVFPKKAWFSFALQVAWGLIAVVAIVKNLRKDKKLRHIIF